MTVKQLIDYLKRELEEDEWWEHIELHRNIVIDILEKLEELLVMEDDLK